MSARDFKNKDSRRESFDRSRCCLGGTPPLQTEKLAQICFTSPKLITNSSMIKADMSLRNGNAAVLLLGLMCFLIGVPGSQGDNTDLIRRFTDIQDFEDTVVSAYGCEILLCTCPPYACLQPRLSIGSHPLSSSEATALMH